MEIVGTVIVTFNPELSILGEQFSSLREQSQFILIVDNGSSADTLSSIKTLMTQDDLIIENEDNVGIARALNLGIEKAINTGATHLLLMDHDSIPPSGFVRTLMSEYSRLIQCENIAAIGPMIVNSDTLYQYPAVRYSSVWRSSIYLEQNSTIFCDHVISSGTLISADSYRAIGPFDEALFIDFVDIEWVLRAKVKGHKCAMTSKTQLKHQLGVKPKKFWLGKWRRHSTHEPLRAYYISRNPWLLLRKETLPLGYRIQEVCRSLARIFFIVAFAEEKWETLWNCIKGLFDGLMSCKNKK